MTEEKKNTNEGWRVFVAPEKIEIKNRKLCEKSEKSAAKWV